MEISGKIIAALPEVTGQGKNGTWRKREYVLETKAQYPKKICFTAWGEKIDQFGLKEGAEVTVSIDLESREYNGRWYTEVKAWKVVGGASAGQSQEQPENFNQEIPEQEGDVLPF